MSISLTPADWIGLFVHFTALSLLAVGGVISTVPDMQRYLVAQQGWLTDPQFTSCVALAQAAPGPNVLFVALMGWNVGLNAGGGLAGGPTAWALALLGVLITMAGILLPSSILTYSATRWAHRNTHHREADDEGQYRADREHPFGEQVHRQDRFGRTPFREHEDHEADRRSDEQTDDLHRTPVVFRTAP